MIVKTPSQISTVNDEVRRRPASKITRHGEGRRSAVDQPNGMPPPPSRRRRRPTGLTSRGVSRQSGPRARANEASAPLSFRTAEQRGQTPHKSPLAKAHLLHTPLGESRRDKLAALAPSSAALGGRQFRSSQSNGQDNRASGCE